MSRRATTSGEGDEAGALLFDAMSALESLLRGIEESGALIIAAARAATDAPPADTPDGERALRHVSFLVLCAARRTEALEREADALVSPLLARWNVIEQR